MSIDYQNGRHDGYVQGRSEGYEQGLLEGGIHGRSHAYDDGYRRGWEEGIASGNVEILKQMEFTREHIADKQLLQDEVLKLRQQLAIAQRSLTQLAVSQFLHIAATGRYPVTYKLKR